jgi:hypothetical protein
MVIPRLFIATDKQDGRISARIWMEFKQVHLTNNAAGESDQLQLALSAEREVVQTITTNYSHCQDCSFPS